MRILITSGLSKGDTGGPAKYSENLAREFNSMGHKAEVATYGVVERHLPIGLRHAYFILKILPRILNSNAVLSLDTFSVGVPSVLLAKVLGKRSVVRVGGDFLWESYVERTGEKISLKQFNANMPVLNFKEKAILYFTKVLIKHAQILAFNTEWQKGIWYKSYKFSLSKALMIKNYIPKRSEDLLQEPSNTILWAGRKIKLKNLGLLREVANEVQNMIPVFKLDIVTRLKPLELEQRIKQCRAVILPSFSEVCPNLILEAVSLNKPYIVTSESGLGEIYDKGGIFVDPFDQKAIKEAILTIMSEEGYSRYRRELLTLKQVRSWREVALDFTNALI